MNSKLSMLLSSQELTHKILQFMQDGLIVFNSDDHIQSMNASALKIFGFTEDEYITGKPIQELFVNTMDAQSLLLQLETETQLDHQEILLIKSNGDHILCSLCALRITDKSEGITLKVFILQDITVRKKAEAKLEQFAQYLEKNNKELDQFAYIVSHDLKAPLRAINNLAQWLYEDLGEGLSEENRRNLDMLKGRVQRMDSLITGILEYSKIGRTKIPSELIDVAMLLTEVLDLLLPPKTIHVEIAAGMPLLQAPKILLLQVFSNLISNAIKYNDKPEGNITIEVEDHETYFQFSVVDNGPGIPAEMHEKVFAIFQTLQSKDTMESTGIGLTIVKKIIEEQGGKIWIESEVGKGSKFIFQWPRNK